MPDHVGCIASWSVRNFRNSRHQFLIHQKTFFEIVAGELFHALILGGETGKVKSRGILRVTVGRVKPIAKGRVPLERALSKLGLCSRAEAAQLITSGAVKVHGVTELDPKRMVNPDTAHIVIEGRKAVRAESMLILFHKPKAVVTTKRDPEGRKTIYDFLPEAYQSFHAVGRLDMHTTGLLLLTNDTKLSNFLTDPQNKIERVYVVKVKGQVSENFADLLTEGVVDAGEHLKADRVKIVKESGKESALELTLSEGKNREIRRLCLALGHEVSSLRRIRYGTYELGDLKPGALQLVEINVSYLIKAP
jgi:23S rRNA pseudouridine2605 synthase